MREATLQKAVTPTLRATANLFPVELYWVGMSHFLTCLVLNISDLNPALTHTL